MRHSLCSVLSRRALLGGLLVMLGLAVVSGCDDDSGGRAGGGPAGEGPLVIGISIPAATHGWPAGVGWWAEQTGKKYPDVQFRLQRASNAVEQVNQVETLLQRGLDGLVILPFDSGTPLGVVQRAKQQGVYVVSVDRGLEEPVADVYVAGDNRAFGRVAAEYMADRLGGEGKIVILRGIPTQIDTERHEAAMAVFNSHAGIEVLASQSANWNQQEALRVMQDFLTRFPDIDAVWASDDDMALGVERALQEAGRTGEMWVLGGAGMKTVVERVMNNDPLIPANVSYPPGMIAAGIHIAVAGLRNDGDITAAADQVPEHLGVTRDQLQAAQQQQGQKRVILDVHLITPENAQQYYFPDSVY